MRIYVKTKDLSRQQWLQYRTRGIGGSDVSIIAGINTFKSFSPFTNFNVSLGARQGFPNLNGFNFPASGVSFPSSG